MYRVVSENLTGLGGSMGTERTWNNWSKYFKTLKSAKEYALNDYRAERKDPSATLEWMRSGSGIRTKDLGFVMYYISKIKTQD